MSKHESGAAHLTPVTSHDTLESVLEPLDCLWLVDTVTCTNLTLAASSLGDTLTRSSPALQSAMLPTNISPPYHPS